MAITLIGIVSSSPKLNNDSLGEIGVILGGFVGGTSTTEGLSLVIALVEAASVCCSRRNNATDFQEESPVMRCYDRLIFGQV